jgi:hypothetical protein
MLVALLTALALPAAAQQDAKAVVTRSHQGDGRGTPQRQLADGEYRINGAYNGLAIEFGMLVVCLPKEKILAYADMFNLADSGQSGSEPTGCRLALSEASELIRQAFGLVVISCLRDERLLI